MKDKLTVSFFGHRFIEESHAIEQKLYELLRIIISRGDREIDFLVGRNGDFDLLTASVVRRLKRELNCDNVFLTLILPYETAELRNNTEAFENYYDTIEISEAAADKNFKYAIVARNRDMIERSDMVVVYVKNQTGGAYQSLRYAKKNDKRIINLYNTQNEN